MFCDVPTPLLQLRETLEVRLSNLDASGEKADISLDKGALVDPKAFVVMLNQIFFICFKITRFGG